LMLNLTWCNLTKACTKGSGVQNNT